MIGGCLSVKSGASQPSGQVVNGIQPGNNQMSTDLTSLGDGTYQVNPQPYDDSSGLPPRLMFVPIVNTLPGGNGNATITGFAWFYATGATNNGHNLTITGQYVTMELPSTGTTYQYTPGAQGQVTAVELTG